MRPEHRLPAVATTQHIGGRPQCRIVVEHVAGEALEERRLVARDAQVVEFHLPLRPRERGGTIERCAVAVLVGQVEHLAARRRDQRPERDTGRRARGDPHAAPEAEDRVEHGPGTAGEIAAVLECQSRAQLSRASDEPRTVRLELQFAVRFSFRDHEMRGPGLGLRRRAAPSRREEDADGSLVLRLHEQLRESRVRVVSRGRRKHDLRVRRQVDGPDTIAQV